MRGLGLAAAAAAALLALALPARAEAATPVSWCGTDVVQGDRLPDAVAGRQVHVVYAFPSDYPDRFGQLASAIASDLAAVDAWWRSQDPARAPRFDQFAFPGCATPFGRLDLTYARLPRDSSYYGPEATEFARITADLVPLSYANPHKKYLVYYDGPAPPAFCGRASVMVQDQGRTFALMYLQNPLCGPLGAGAFRAATAAHELLHSFGALMPNGPPHPCPNDAFHPCDHPLDVLRPDRPELPIENYVLDAGRDDYYAHSGSWWDVQDSDWLLKLDRPQQPLSVTVSGPGAVASDEPGIACPAVCAIPWDGGSEVSLLATPREDARLVRWEGDCTGRDTCNVTMDRPRAVTAVFGPSFFELRIAVVGRGRVTSDLVGACARRCAPVVDADATVRLRARAARGYRFAGWSGACRGRRVTCTVTMTSARTVRATFRRS